MRRMGRTSRRTQGQRLANARRRRVRLRFAPSWIGVTVRRRGTAPRSTALEQRMRTNVGVWVVAAVLVAPVMFVPASATPVPGAGPVIPLLDVSGVACAAAGQCLVAGQDELAQAGVAMTTTGGALWTPA